MKYVIVRVCAVGVSCEVVFYFGAMLLKLYLLDTQLSKKFSENKNSIILSFHPPYSLCHGGERLSRRITR